MTDLNFAKEAAGICAEKKATRINIIDLSQQSDLCDAMLICSASNERQVRAISEAIQEHFRNATGKKPSAVEGMNGGQWVVIDYMDTIVHIFQDQIRDYYALESLWPQAKMIRARTTEESQT